MDSLFYPGASRCIPVSVGIDGWSLFACRSITPSTAEDFEEDLKDAVARNSQLLKIVCHDIANPLTVILADSDRDLTSPRSEQERLTDFRNTQRLRNVHDRPRINVSRTKVAQLPHSTRALFD